MNLLLPVLFAATAAAAFAVLWALAGVVRLLRPAAARAAEADEGALVRAMAAARPPKDWEGRLDRSFDRMVRWTLLGMTPQQALGMIALCAAAAGAACFLWWGDWIAAVVGLAAGGAAPLALLLALRRRWRAAVQEQLPDGLFLLARSLRAGLSLEQAFAAVRSFCQKPLTDLFGRCADQLELGLSAPEALQRAADGTGLADLHALASVTVLHRDVGGHLPALIDRLAVSVRDRNEFRNYFRAATALSRVSAVFLALAPPVIACYLIYDQPDLFYTFFRSTLGLTALAAAVALEVVGVVWISMLLRGVDY